MKWDTSGNVRGWGLCHSGLVILWLAVELCKMRSGFLEISSHASNDRLVSFLGEAVIGQEKVYGFSCVRKDRNIWRIFGKVDNCGVALQTPWIPNRQKIHLVI